MGTKSLFNGVGPRIARYTRVAARHLPDPVRRAAVSLVLQFQPQIRPHPLRLHRRQVRALVANIIAEKGNPVDVLCVGDIADYVAPPPNQKAAFAIDDRIEEGRLRSLSRTIAEERPGAKSSALIVYATAGILSIWERLEEDLDLCLARGYRQIILALCTERFRPLDFEGHSYILSVLLNCFPRRKFSTKLEVFVAPQFLSMPGRPLLRPLQALSEEARKKLRRLCPWNWHAENLSPTHFSGLILSVEPRRRDD